jgi:hypothetical protein
MYIGTIPVYLRIIWWEKYSTTLILKFLSTNSRMMRSYILHGPLLSYGQPGTENVKDW